MKDDLPPPGAPFDPIPGSTENPTQRIGPYLIIQELGRGAQGTVYLAEESAPHRRVALKVLHGHGNPHPDAIARFQREAEITSKIDDPGICPIYATGQDRNSFWIAMRYIEGESLAKAILKAKADPGGSESFLELTREFDSEATVGTRDENAPRPEEDSKSSVPSSGKQLSLIFAFFEKAARTLHAAHVAGVIHRDIKPGNLIVTKDQTPVILDFGLAEEIEGDEAPVTITGEQVGTPAYMSPEQIAGQCIRLDCRTDVYSLGVTLFECLALARPFEAKTREGLYQAILSKDPRDLRELNSHLPRDVRTVVRTAIARDRDRRYQTAQDLAQDLRHLQRGEPIEAQPPSPLRRLVSWASRNRALSASLFALIAVLATGVIVFGILYREKATALAEREILYREKASTLAERERLADLKLANDLVTAEARLWPSWPERIGAEDGFDRWLEQARALVARSSADRARLESSLGADVVKAAIEARSTSRPADPESMPARDPSGLSWVDALVLDSLGKTQTLESLIPRVEQRKAFAATIDAATDSRPSAWTEARRIVAHPSGKYKGLQISIQRGLIPLGADRKSEFEEFAVYGTGTIPKRDVDSGRLDLQIDSAIVLVLLPGGTFTMGEDTARQRPGYELTLVPFFIGKHEVTQAQAKILGEGTLRAKYFPGYKVDGPAITPRNPMEYITWTEALDACRRFGLMLPTEAQWEYACRGGTTSAWWTGDDPDSLKGAENVFDKFGARVEPTRKTNDTAGWDDGYPYHAPVGSFDPNRFGLYDMHGNVQEWCIDCFSKVTLTLGDHRLRDGRIIPGPSERGEMRVRSVRGGSHYFGTTLARTTNRTRFNPTEKNHALGFRAVRMIIP